MYFIADHSDHVMVRDHIIPTEQYESGITPRTDKGGSDPGYACCSPR